MKHLYGRCSCASLALILICFFGSSVSAQIPKCLNTDEIVQLPSKGNSLYVDSGDFNNDGQNDLVLVQLLNSGGNLIIYNGNADGIEYTDTWNIFNLVSAISPGDLNADGYDDIVVSVTDAVYFYMGSQNGPVLNAEMTIEGFSQPQKAGDLNGDNVADLFLYTNGVLVTYSGSNQGLQKTDEVTAEELGINGFSALFPAGDINKDGRPDIGLQTETDQYVFYGTANGFSQTNSLKVQYERANWSSVGDVNGDGFDDMLLTQPTGENLPKDIYIYLFLGSANGLQGPSTWEPDVKIDPTIGYDSYGSSSGPVGDINGDGFNDFYIYGSSKFSRVFFGNANLPNPSGDIILARDLFALFPVGDLNGDGFNDLIGPNGSNVITSIYGASGGLRDLVNCPATDFEPDIVVGGTNAISAGDVDKDGINDIVVGFDNYLGDDEIESGEITVLLGAPTGFRYGGGYEVQNNPFGEVIGSGDFNGDGYSDVIAGYEMYGFNGARGRVMIFYGSAGGIGSDPDWILDGDPNEEQIGSSVSSPGDFNGDGFDDFIIDATYLYFGSASGPVRNTDYSFIMLAVGDVNNDGFQDIFRRNSVGGQLYWGSSNGLVPGPNVNLSVPRAAGDINHDGYDDVFEYSFNTQTLSLFLGSPAGFTPTNTTISAVLSPTAIGDINGDGFDDLAVQSRRDTLVFESAPANVDIYLGTEAGLSNSIYKSIRGNEADEWLSPTGPIGDINNDGIDDIAVSANRKVWIIYGEGKPSTVECRTDTTLYANTDCSVIANDINPSGDPSLFDFRITGATQLSGRGSASGALLRAGYNYVTYLLRSDTTMKCTFAVIVRDTIPPKVVCVPGQTFCGTGRAEYVIPKLAVEDNCKIRSVSFEITGAIRRSGVGNDASGFFNPGRNIIHWTVLDSSGNKTICTTIVNVVAKFHTRISNAYQVNAQQSAANTIYLGYANNTLRLSVYVGSTNAGFRYKWSTGDTTRFTRVRHDLPGTYEHWVAVTNPNGCIDTARTIITVVDNYCPNPLKDFITKNFPQLLKEPWIQALIMATSSSYVCYNGSTTCVPTGSLQQVINNGAKLGKCNAVMTLQSPDVVSSVKPSDSRKLQASVSPNPASGAFTIRVDGTGGNPYSVRITNTAGVSVESIQNIRQSQVTAGAALSKGMYFVEIRQGANRVVIRIVKIN